MPRRRYTLLAAAVLSVLHSQDNSAWEVKQVAEECGLEYGSVYPVLQRLHGEGLVGRLYVSAPVGHPRLHFDLTDRGKRITRQLLGFMPNPVGALNSWRVTEDDEPAPRVKPTKSKIHRTRPATAAPVRTRRTTPNKTATPAGARRR